MAFGRAGFYTKGYYFWLVLLALSLAALAVLLVYMLASGGRAGALAQKSGQRIEVLLSAEPKEAGASSPAALLPLASQQQILPEPAPPEDGRMPSARIPPQDQPDVVARDLPPLAEEAANPNSLPEANPDLVEKIGDLSLPKADEDGLTPAAYYARLFKRPAGTKLVAVLIPGLGQERGLAEAALNLPPGVSVSFSPYARALGTWNANARRLGHETYLDLALPAGNTDGGPLALDANVAPDKLKPQIHAQLARLPNIVGVYAPAGEIFSLATRSALQTAEEFRTRGLFLIAAEPASGFGHLLSAGALRGVAADRILQAGTGETEISQALAWLEGRANERGAAFMIVEPTPVALRQLASWLATLPEKKLALAPVSALVPAARIAAPAAAGKETGEEKPERRNPALEKSGEKKAPAPVAAQP